MNQSKQFTELLTAVDILIEKRLRQSTLTSYQEGVIANISSDDNDKWYEVSIDGNIVRVYSRPFLYLDIGDIVTICIPNGEFSQRFIDKKRDLKTSVSSDPLVVELDPTVPSWAKQPTKPGYTATEVGAIPVSQKGANNGVATLDANGKIIDSQAIDYLKKANYPETILAETIGYGVISGLEVTHRTPATMTVDISSGVIHKTGFVRQSISSGSLTIDSAESDGDRIDLIYVNSSGVISYLKGTKWIPALSGKIITTITTNFAPGDTITIANNVFTATMNIIDQDEFTIGMDIASTMASLVAAMRLKTALTNIYDISHSGCTFTLTEKNIGGGNTPNLTTTVGTGKVFNEARIVSLAGTSKTIPSLPEGSIPLSYVHVVKGNTYISGLNLTDIRPRKYDNLTFKDFVSEIGNQVINSIINPQTYGMTYTDKTEPEIVLSYQPTFVAGTRVNPASGSTYSDPNYITTGFIKVVAGESYTLSTDSSTKTLIDPTLTFYVYDANQTYIPTYNGSGFFFGDANLLFTISNRYPVAYIRISVNISSPIQSTLVSSNYAGGWTNGRINPVKVSNQVTYSMQNFSNNNMLIPIKNADSQFEMAFMASGRDYNIVSVNSPVEYPKEATIRVLNNGSNTYQFADLSSQRYVPSSRGNIGLYCESRNFTPLPYFHLAFNDGTGEYDRLLVEPDSIPMQFVSTGIRVRKNNALDNTWNDSNSVVVNLYDLYDKIMQFKQSVMIVEASGNIPMDKNILLVKSLSGIVTLTLPLAELSTGKQYSIKKTQGNYDVVVIGTNNQTIDGELNITLRFQYQAVNVVSDGYAWYVL